MNKQEKLKEVVQCFSGVWPHPECVYMGEFLSNKTFSTNNYGDDSVCTKTDFNQCARELGYINGYRWGVEYPTNGKKPDLPDTILVYATTDGGECGKCAPVNEFYWSDYRKFKVVDVRYKPADTSYLDSVSEIPESKSNAENVGDWYNYDNQEMKTLPDNNTDVELLMGGAYQTRVEYIGILGFKVVFYRYDTHEIDHAELPTASFRPLDCNRKAESEKKRVVDAAYKSLPSKELASIEWSAHAERLLDALYYLGYLRTPSK